MTNGERFVLDLTKITSKTGAKVDYAVRKIVLDIGARVVMRSPVGDPSRWAGAAPAGYTGGRFRANWQYGEGVRPGGTLDALDRGGAKTLAAIAAAVKPDAAGKVHFLTNNLSYALPLERGWSKQAPYGMVGLTVREYQSIVGKVAKEIKG